MSVVYVCRDDVLADFNGGGQDAPSSRVSASWIFYLLGYV